jgi:phage gpG-like protein
MPSGSGAIFPADIASAVMSLRQDKIVSASWSLKPSMGIVAKDIERLSLDIRSWKVPLTQVIKQVMIPSIRKNFDTGGRPAWEPLAENTIKARGFSAWPILEVTGKLRRKATQLNIWEIGTTFATVRALPDDVFYGAFHQAGASRGESGIADKLLSHAPGSKEANALIQKFIPSAVKELEGRGILSPGKALSLADKSFIKNRAVGLLLEADAGWNLPARPFIMWQSDDVPKMEAIFSAWMEERAIKSGRFHRE